jgi:hypothetical protein
MTKSSLTQDALKSRFGYDPATGFFTHKKNVSKMRTGDRAGSLNTRTQYRYIRFSTCNISEHQLAFLYQTGSFPVRHIDHINGDGLDNRWVNLREVTVQENSRNAKIRKNNKTGVMGVGLHKPTKRWRAYINVSGKQLHLGLFDEFDDAVFARREAEKLCGFHENHGRR